MRREENGLGRGGRGEKWILEGEEGGGVSAKVKKCILESEKNTKTQFKGPYVEMKRVIAAVCTSAHYRVQYNNFDNLMTPTY
jgi:hypothetical protein